MTSGWTRRESKDFPILGDATHTFHPLQPRPDVVFIWNLAHTLYHLVIRFLAILAMFEIPSLSWGRFHTFGEFFFYISAQGEEI